MSEDRIDGPADGAAGPAGPDGQDGPAGPDGASRRRMLMLGAAGASMVVTIRPALAQTAASVLTCEIPIPEPRLKGFWIAADGRVTLPLVKGAVPPPARPLTGEEVRTALRQNGNFPGTTRAQTQAYTRYMQRLQNGNSGFTCFVSIKGR